MRVVMKNLSKNAVILDNLSSPYIHQAIIILKDNQSVSSEKIIQEAEKIVSSYFSKVSINPVCLPEQKNTALKAAVIILGIAFGISLFMQFL